jgi:penicillin-binding protein activator
MSSLRQYLVFVSITLIMASHFGCGPRYLRSGESSDFEEAAMSTRLDRKDLESMFKEATQSLSKAGLMRHWKALSRDGQLATLAVLSIENETSEHVETSMMTLVKKLETTLINDGVVTVLSRSNQPELLRELKTQGSSAFDQARIAVMGRQLGAQYLLTGKLYDITEKSLKGRRVQYFLFMQVIEVETGAIRWQMEVERLKGLTAG